MSHSIEIRIVTFSIGINSLDLEERGSVPSYHGLGVGIEYSSKLWYFFVDPISSKLYIFII